MTKLLISFCNAFPHDLALCAYDLDSGDSKWIDLSNLKNEIWGVTGLSFHDNRYWFLTQLGDGISGLSLLDLNFNLVKNNKLMHNHDTHSLIPFEGGFLIADTMKNRIVKVDYNKKNSLIETEYWRYSNEETDAVHINSLSIINGEIFVAMFGSKPSEGWQHAKNGKIVNISTNTIVCDNLFHPHTLLNIDGMLYWLESGTSLIHRINDNKHEVVLKLSGYLRGMTSDDTYYYVAASAARRKSRSTGTVNIVPLNQDHSSWVYKIDKKSLQFKKFELTSLGSEIYDLILLNEQCNLNFNSEVDPVVQRIWKFEDKLLEQDDAIETLQETNIKNQQKTIQEASDAIKQLSSEKASLISQIENQQKTIQEASDAIKQLSSEKASLIEQIDTLQKINLQNQKTIQEASDAIKQLSSEKT